MTDPRFSGGNDPYLEWDAAYVLGALSPAERREFEHHKQDCARCSLAVTELAGMTGLLAAVPLEELTSGITASSSAVDAPAGGNALPEEVLSFLESNVRGRRRRRWQLAGGASLLAAAAVALVVGLNTGHSSHRPTAAPLAQLVSSPLHAEVRLAVEPWGTRLDVTCTYDKLDGGAGEAAEQPRPYQLVVIDKAGNDLPAGGWQAGPGSTVWPTGSVQVPLNDIAKVQIRTGTGLPLLQLTR
jgi:Putative zinc-finger